MSWEQEVEDLTKRLANLIYEQQPVDTEAVTQAIATVLATLAADLQEQHGDRQALAFTTDVYSAVSEAFTEALFEDADTSSVELSDGSSGDDTDLLN